MLHGMAKRRLPAVACASCGREFVPTRAWQRFCGPSCRRESSQEARSVEYACTYCGLGATGIDHVPPVSVRPRLVDLGLAARYPFVEVRCCAECNAVLGARPLWTVPQRRAYIHKALARRYRRYLEIPNWDEGELRELSPMLQEFTRHGLAVRDVTRERLRASTPEGAI